jgi:diguanylate cyclase (GGDEF)-like protein/PAS domain S-box-containing protein
VLDAIIDATRGLLRSRGPRTFLLPALVLVLGLAISLMAWQHSRETLTRQLAAELKLTVDEVTDRIEAHFETNVQILLGVAAHFGASTQVARAQFARYVQALHLPQRHPGIQAVGYVRLIAAEEQAAHVAELRREGFAEYAITPPGARAFYTPVVYIEPLSGSNLRALGYDNATEPVRWAAATRARDTGEPALSGKVILRQEDAADAQPGFVLLVPVYREGSTPSTVAERRAALTGWVGSVLRMGDLMQAALTPELQLSHLSVDIGIEIFDGERPREEARLFRSGQAERTGAPAFHTLRQLPLQGHVWTLRFTSTPAFDARLRQGKPFWIALAGTSSSLLLALLVWVLVRGQQRSDEDLHTARQTLAARHAMEAEIRTLNASLEAKVGARTAALRASEERFRAFFDLGLVGMAISTPSEGLVACNAYLCRLLGYASEEIEALSWRDITHPDDLDAETALYARVIAGEIDGYRLDKRFMRKDGSAVPCALAVSCKRQADGEVAYFVGFIIDITERQRAQARLRESEEHLDYLAYHDALTGLPNRRLGRERLSQYLLGAKAHRRALAVLFMDLDKLKYFNDTYGHLVGDTLLIQAAERLAEQLRSADGPCRLGGDEFMLVLTELAPEQAAIEAQAMSQRILDILAQPFHIDNAALYVSFCIGIALYPDDGTDAETLMNHADAALAEAKRTGQQSYRFYEPQMNARLRSFIETRDALRLALERREFRLHYQPQIDLRSGQVVGVEALFRWQRPDQGLIMPGAFLGTAEETGLIVPIGYWVLREACRQAAAWHSAGWEGLVVAVNLSAVQLRQGDLEQQVLDAVALSGLDPRRLELELTESILLEHGDSVRQAVERWKACGIQLSIDDFGTGYSSLAYLKRFKVDTLKIDRSFVTDLHTNAEDRAIVQAVIQIARAFNLRTLAEGVEDARLAQALKSMGCDAAQGYLYAKPMPAAELERWLQARDRDTRG